MIAVTDQKSKSLVFQCSNASKVMHKGVANSGDPDQTAP